jgi:hypothetical protein
MKKFYVTLMVVLAVLAMAGVASATPPDSKNFVSPLSGDEEVPPRDTNARGNAVYHLGGDGTELHYRLIVANIENVAAAHIHCGDRGVSGPVGVTLFTGSPGGGRVDGTLAQGTVTAPDPGNACGWTSLAEVVDAMRSGNTYTNVHTNDGVAPTNTGPGDFPGGEVRGQIREAGPSQ